MTLETEINKSSARVFRRAFIRRRSSSTGLYEASWVSITKYVKKWGNISTAIDDVKLNQFKHSGINLVVSNDNAAFNREDDIQSLWNGFLTRYNTLLKIESGYIADDDAEFPINTSDVVAHWKLDDDAATTVVESFTGTHTATAQTLTSAITATGKLDNGFLFNNNSTFALSDNISGDITGAHSYCWWMKLSTNAINQIPISLSAGGHPHINLNNASRTLIQYNNSTFKYFDLNTDYNDLEWHFCVITSPGLLAAELDNIKFYVDGVSQTIFSEQSVDDSRTLTTVKINHSFRGTLDNVMLFDKELSLEDVTQLYNSGVGSVSLPNVSQGIFLLSNEIALDGAKNQVQLRGKSLVSIFNEVIATDIVGLGTTQTASDVITKIRDHSDGSGNVIFRQFISSTSWTIQTTTTNLNLATTTSLDGLTAWELMVKLAEAEGFVAMINRSGGFEFRNRDPRTTASSFDIRGLGFREMHIKKIPAFKEALNKTFNFIRVKHGEDDTSTSFASFGTGTSVDSSNTSWKYGQRILELENEFLNSVSADAVGSSLFSLFKDPKNEITLVTKFLPQLEILDRVALFHRSFSLAGTTLWNQFNWDEANWAGDTGENFDFEGENYKVISRKTDLNKFENNYVMREV